MLTVTFENSNAARKSVFIRCSHNSLDHICEWYASHHAGDKYDIYVNGHKRILDNYGLVIGLVEE